MSYSTGKTLQYGVTLAQESEAIVHTFRRRTLGASSKSASPQSYGIHVISRMYCVLTLIAVRIE